MATGDPQGRTLEDAILAGDISLDDAMTQYRPPTGGERAQTFVAIATKAARDAYLSGTSAELRLVERGLALVGADSAAQWMRGFADYVAPGGEFTDDVAESGFDVSPEVPQAAANEPSGVMKALTQYLPEGLGSSAGIIALPGGLRGVALRGALVGAGQQFVEAKAAGGTEGEAWVAFVGGAALGATDAWSPLGKLFERADKMAGGKLKEIAWNGIVKGGAQEFTQEVGQTIGENLLAMAVYDEDREIIENVLEAGQGGALTGMLIGALVGHQRSRAQQQIQGGNPRTGEEGSQAGDPLNAPDSVMRKYGKPVTEPDEDTATLAQDLGADTVEEAPEHVKRYVEARGGRVSIGHGKDGARLRRPAGISGRSIMLDAQDATNSFLDHEVGHLAFGVDPEGAQAAQEAIEALAPGLREAAQEDYVRDSLANQRRELGRDLTAEEEATIRAETPPDEAFARINEDLSGVVRLLRTNPQAFAKLDNPGTLKRIFRAAIDLGRKLTGKPVPNREALALAEVWKSISGTEKLSPEIGVRVAETLRDYLDGLVRLEQQVAPRTETTTPRTETAQEVPEESPSVARAEDATVEATMAQRMGDIPEPGTVPVTGRPDTYVGRRLLSFSGEQLDVAIADRLSREDAAVREQFPDRGDAWYARVADARRQARDPRNIEGDQAALRLRRAGIKPLPPDPGGYSTEAYVDARAQQRTGKPDSSKVDQGPRYAARRRNPQENTPEFLAWFKKSEVRRKNGKPLAVYHAGSFDENEHGIPNIGDQGMHFGTKTAAELRDYSKPIDDMIVNATYEQDEKGRWHWSSDGFDSALMEEDGFLTQDIARGNLEDFASEQDFTHLDPMPVTKAYLSIQKMKRVKDQGSDWSKAVAQAKLEGYDGLIYKNEYEYDDSYVVFNSNQIKSVKNKRPTDSPDIRYAAMRRADEVIAATDEERVKMVRSDVAELLEHSRSSVGEVAKWVSKMAAETKEDNARQYANLLLEELRRRMGIKYASRRRRNSQEKTPEFKAWFKHSKVTRRGKPLVVYHGTAKEFNTFQRGKQTSWSVLGEMGHWFSDEPFVAETYAEYGADPSFSGHNNGQNTKPVYLSIQNPKVLNMKGDTLPIDIFEIFQEAKDAGHDGLILKNLDDNADGESFTATHYVVFSPTQIKSAIGNNGKFDPGDPDIRHAMWRRALPTSGTTQIPWDQRDRFLRYAQDAWRGPGRWRDALATAGKVTEANDIVLQEGLRRSGTLKVIQDETANYVAPLREAIARGSVTADDAGRYLLARAAPDRNRMVLFRGGPVDGSGMSDADAARIVAAAQNGPNAAKYAEIAALFDKLNGRKLDLMEQYGLLTPEATLEYRTQEPFYAPMKSDERVSVLYGEEGRGTQTGIGRTRRKEFRAATGRGSEADNPIIFATMDLMAAIERGMWNATTGRATLEMAREFSDPKVALVDVPATQTTMVNGQIRTVPAMERANEVVVKENGIPRVIRFGKGWEIVAETIKGSDRGQADALLAALRIATRTIAGLSTRWNPAFQPVNFVRDALNAHLNASADFGPAAASVMINPKTLVWAAREVQKNGPWAERFRNAGGPVAFLDLARTFEEEAKRTIKEIQRLQSPNAPWEMTRRYAGNVMNLLEAMGNISENASRLAAFKYAIEELGASDQRAAQYAKGLTTNFETRGSNPWMTTLYAFSNASVQGTARVAQALRTPWGQRAAASLVAGAFLLSYMNRVTGGDDEDGVPRWDKIPDWQRRSNAIFLVGDTKLMIPLPFVWNIFSALGTEIERGAFGGQTALDSTKAIGGALAGSLNPLGGEADPLDTITPTLADPIVQVFRNQDFAGRAIFPPWERGPDSGKAFDTTSPTMVHLAEGLNELSGGDPGVPGLVDVSPATLEFVFKQYLGGVGGEGSRVLRLAEKAISGEDIEVQDVPVVRRFFGSLGLQEQRGYYKQRRALIETQVMREKAGNPYDERLWRLRKRANRWDEQISDLEKSARGASGPARGTIRAELRAVFLEATAEIEEAMK